VKIGHANVSPAPFLEPRRWAPFEPTRERQNQLIEFAATQPRAKLDVDLIEGAEKILRILIASCAREIVDREGLPHIAHLICGWGDASVRGRPLSAYLGDFAQPAGGAQQKISQCDSDGDFHPWQSFAYCCMAGIPLGTLVSASSSILGLVSNSTDLNTREDTDLGHLLYVTANMSPRARPSSYIFGGCIMSLKNLFELALRAHEVGGFEVCRKFHLTEGLCALSRDKSYRSFSGQAYEYLHGQLLSLGPLALIADIVLNRPGESSETLGELRERLVLGTAVENIYYYAGHVIELAGIALQFGFVDTFQYVPWAVLLINALNRLLPRIAAELHFAESFYAFAHYRRAYIFLLQALSLPCPVVLMPVPGDKTALDCYEGSLPENDCGMLLKSKAITFATPKQEPSRLFARILSAYNAQAKPGMDARGEFAHFRKILPRGWPRGLHYEFLVENANVGVELHYESPVLNMHPFFLNLVKAINADGQLSCLYDPHWWYGRGRIRVLFSVAAHPSIIANAMCLFIISTFTPIEHHCDLVDSFSAQE
jgi:hypothetical protein